MTATAPAPVTTRTAVAPPVARPSGCPAIRDALAYAETHGLRTREVAR